MNVILNELSNIVPMMRQQADGSFKKTSALEEMFNKLDKKFKDQFLTEGQARRGKTAKVRNTFHNLKIFLS